MARSCKLGGISRTLGQAGPVPDLIPRSFILPSATRPRFTSGSLAGSHHRFLAGRDKRGIGELRRFCARRGAVTSAEDGAGSARDFRAPFLRSHRRGVHPVARLGGSPSVGERGPYLLRVAARFALVSADSLATDSGFRTSHVFAFRCPSAAARRMYLAAMTMFPALTWPSPRW